MATESNWYLLTNKWFVLLGASLVFILTIVLLAVRRSRIIRQREKTLRDFNRETSRRGLTSEERDILWGIAERSGLKRTDVIFTLPAAFERGAGNLMKEVFSAGYDLGSRKQLNKTVGAIKVKLGFDNTSGRSATDRSGKRHLSSRGLTVGKGVSIAQKNDEDADRIDATVIGNNRHELILRPDSPVLSVPGDLWNVRYYHGSAVWEFDSLAIACGMDGLELNHSDNVHYSNRRRFNRAAINRPGLVAKFPMLYDNKGDKPKSPEFVPCTITEISGVGLRVKTDLDLRHGDRIIMVFELEQGRWLSDTGEVRGDRDTALTHSVAVELTGVDEQGVKELIRVTNYAATASQKGKDNWDESADDIIPADANESGAIVGGMRNG
jgi:hypothetical protein